MNQYSTNSLVRATEFFNELQGKTWSAKQMNELATTMRVRQALHRFALERGWCKKLENGKYEFDRMDFHPNIVKSVLKDCKEYNKSLQNKKKFDNKVAKQEKRIKQKPKKEETPMVLVKHKGKAYKFEISQETIVKNFSKMMESLDKTTTWQSKYHTLEHIYHRNIQELKSLDKQCIGYLDLIDTHKDRIEELEKERENVRELFYNKVVNELKNEINN